MFIAGISKTSGIILTTDNLGDQYFTFLHPIAYVQSTDSPTKRYSSPTSQRVYFGKFVKPFNRGSLM